MKLFEILLVVLTLASGLILLADKLYFARRRAARAGLLDSEPVLVDYSRAFFPVLAIVLVVRSFIAEPYKIPSSSMMPNLLIGDFILVNKFSYGLRLPLNNAKIVPLGEPKRGDVVVFHFPGHSDADPAKGENFIKRVIGVPGDEVAFQGDGLILNGEPVKYDNKGIYAGHLGQGDGSTLLVEHLPGRTHTVLETDYPRGQGQWTVPAGKYLVMGDNRDNSDDGRFWGLLPEENLRGKAFLIWLNCSGWFCKDGFEPSRIGSTIN
ncbi:MULTISPECIES: signal peptidase I [Stenotrophomonas]|jgi:signal peptidase I|uniref:Signal peptidase I n=1 Tax=Stenotrophomonas maltophilia TaxID=40324 RepID=A0A4S2D9G9_STEMA|nr:MULTISPECIES: signal peptidase I [Stenotrophomonas]MBD3827658.1 signal peptidase I [Stenotrophomonas sp.]QIO89074.1 S26 family signal peptidase [Stenotrophomonas rhizophila]TGY37313.1 signal peptidase I [Stenotrophomonas maltophilia]